MKAYVAVTDQDWFQFLSQQRGIDEVNFWKPVSIVWETFGIRNGAATYAEMRARIEYYREAAPSPREDYEIGNIILQDPFFLPRDRWISSAQADAWLLESDHKQRVAREVADVGSFRRLESGLPNHVTTV